MKNLLMCLGVGLSLSACAKDTPAHFSKTQKKLLEQELAAGADCAKGEITEAHYLGTKEGVQYEIAVEGHQFQVVLINENCNDGVCVRGGPEVSGKYEKIPHGYYFPDIGALYEEGTSEAIYFCEIYKENVVLKKTELRRAMTSQEHETICK